MRYLVGLSTALILVEDKNVTKLESGCFYGVTFDENFIYAFRRSKGGTVFVYNKKLNKVKQQDVKVSHLHQAHYDPVNDRIYVTNTGSNKLTEFDRNFGNRKDHKWTQNDRDTNHINSLFRYKDRLYAYEHDLKGQNKHRVNGGVRRLSPDFKSERVMRIADQGHNVWIEDDWIYVCDTFNRSLVRRPLSNEYEDTIETLLSTEEYGQFGTRGLAVADDFLLIGLSKWLDRSKRETKHTGYILTYDRQYNKIDELFLNDGQVFEIRLLDQLDHAHNGLIF